MMMLRVTDLKQWAYCGRIVYFQRRMPGVGKQTYKMEEGKTAQEMIEQLEMRRTLREYGFEGTVRKFGLWLENEEPGISRQVGLIVGDADRGRDRRVQVNLW
jgi:CRISPR-associated exonuclease Cas4